MAFDTLLWVRKQKTGNCASRSVLRVLADHAGQDHSCYLRTRLIAAETDLSEAGVRKALTRLLDAGLVRVYDRYDRTGKRISNRYQVLVDGIETPAPDAEDYADVRGVTLSEVDVPLSGVEGQTLNGGEGLPHKEASSSEAPIVKGRAAAPRTATRLPDDFMPDEKMRAWFADEKLATVIDGVTEHAKFVDYFIGAPGIKGRKHDWPATWRNWMRTAAERSGQRRPGNSLAPVSGAPRHYQSTTDGKVMQTLALAEKFRQMEEKQ
jgi:DNA-binding transcriptional ArsR family regulator